MIYNDEDYVPEYIEDQIIKKYLSNKYYWTVGFGCFIIGFLLGVVIK